MILSIGMMVKNEEKYLDMCLKSLLPILENLESELIIVDTGSTDNTVEIAKRYTEKVYYHEWNKNFSEIRNRTIEYSTGKWFFCIDGDEVLSNPDEIITFFKSKEYKKYNTCTMKIKNYIKSNDRESYTTFDSMRLFKNDTNFKYSGSIHNQPQYKLPIKKIKATIEHYGYIKDDKELMEKKFRRTGELLINELNKNPMDFYYRHQLISTYMLHGDNIKALEQVEILMDSIKSEEKRMNKHIFSRCICVYLTNNRLDKCEKLISEALSFDNKDEQYKIDIYFYSGECNRIRGNLEKCLEDYNKYLILLDKYRNGEMELDITSIVDSESFKNKTMLFLANEFYKKYEYNKVIEMSLKIDNIIELSKIFNIIIESFINIDNVIGLKKYFDKHIRKLEKKYVNKFIIELENAICKLNHVNKMAINTEFSEDNSAYGILNKMRISEGLDEVISLIDVILDKYDLNEEIDCYGEVVYYMLKTGYSMENIEGVLNYNTLIKFIEFCEKSTLDINEYMLNYIYNHNLNQNKFAGTKMVITFARILMLLNKLDIDDYEKVFNIYINCGIKYIKYIYSDFVIDNEIIYEVKNDEEKFFIYMLKAYEVREDNKVQYIRYLNKALKLYPYMKKGIEILMNTISNYEKQNNDKINALKCKLIDNINILIASNKLNEAINIINEYERFMGMDLEILMLKSKISLNEKSEYLN